MIFESLFDVPHRRATPDITELKSCVVCSSQLCPAPSGTVITQQSSLGDK